MRFYDIAITESAGSLTANPGDIVKLQVGSEYRDMHFTSFKNGVTLPGALNIEIDIPKATEDIPVGDAMVKIWGVDLGIVNQASILGNLQSPKTITMSAGMQKGLPLATAQAMANPPRNGVIFQGSILQAFGNWQGSEQSIDLVITTQLAANTSAIPSPKKNLVFKCDAGTNFSDALKKTFQDGGITAAIKISPNLVASRDIYSMHDSVGSLAQDITLQSKGVFRDSNYLGVKLIKTIDGYLCSDNTTKEEPKSEIFFTDLIGQPTWLDYATMQMKVVMRSDIHVGDTINFPKSNILNTPKSLASFKDNIAKTGSGFVSAVRHIGNFRQPDGNSWVSVINIIPNQL